MSFSENKEQQLKKMPLIETSIKKSKDGKYIINKTTITSIKPVAYFEAVLADEEAKNIEVNEEVLEA